MCRGPRPPLELGPLGPFQRPLVAVVGQPLCGRALWAVHALLMRAEGPQAAVPSLLPEQTLDAPTGFLTVTLNKSQLIDILG